MKRWDYLFTNGTQNYPIRFDILLAFAKKIGNTTVQLFAVIRTCHKNNKIFITPTPTLMAFIGGHQC